jgi:serine/threonine-protein kinase
MMRSRSMLRLETFPLVIWILLGANGLAPALAQTPEAPAASAPPAPSASFPVAPPQTPPSDAPKDPNAARVEEADRLFKRGVDRMDAGDFAAACPLLEQSQATDASSGTLLNLADCYEHLGRTASADRAFAQSIELARAAGRQDRIQVAEARRNRLATELRRLRVLSPAQSGLSVTLDGAAIAFGAAVAVDPGAHDIRAGAPGFKDYVAQVAAPNAGVTLDVRIPELTPATNTSANSTDAHVDTGSTELGGREIAAITCGAVGLVGVVGGTVFGLRSISKHDESDEYCDGKACWYQRGFDAMDSARSLGTLSTISFVVGGAGLGAAAVLWFLRPKTPTGVSAELGVLPGSVQLRGSF